MSYLSDIKVTTRYPIDWETSKRIAEATKALLLPESNLDRNDPESLMFRGGEMSDEEYDKYFGAEIELLK